MKLFCPGLGKPPTLDLNDGQEMIDQATVEKPEFYNELLLCHGMEHMSLLLWSFSQPA